MGSVKFLVVEKATGIPVYTRSTTGEEDSDFLFSGLMVAINSIMKEMSNNISEKIVTDSYTIYAKERIRYYVFVVGNINKEGLAFNMLDYIGNYLDFVPKEGDITSFDDETTSYLDKIVDELFEIFTRSNFVAYLYCYSRFEGIKTLSGDRNKDVENYLMRYLQSLTNYYSHTSYGLLDENYSFVLTSRMKDEDTVVILLIKFEHLTVQEYISFKHKIAFHNYKNLGILIDRWPEITKDVLSIERFLEESTRQTVELVGSHYVPLQNIELDMLLEVISPVLPALISDILSLNPVCIYGDEEVAQQVTALLQSLTHITDTGTNLSDVLPFRLLSLSDTSFLPMLEELGYSFLDVNSMKYRAKNKPLSWVKNTVSNTYRKYKGSEVITKLAKEIDEFWTSLNHLVSLTTKGVDVKSLLLGKNEKDKSFSLILSSCNPLFLGTMPKQQTEEVLYW